MRDEVKKEAPSGAYRVARELPMPRYEYQIVRSSSGGQNDKSTTTREPVKDQKIKSLQNLSFA